MKPLLLSRADTEILQALGRYRLLTIAQIVRLGITDRKNAGERLKRLAGVNYVDSVRGSAQTPGVFWLTPKAGKHFAELFGDEWAKAASGKGFVDGAHMGQRLATIDVCIAARSWAPSHGYDIASLRTDFDAAGADLQRATTLEWNGTRYTPDALGELVDAQGVRWVFAVEVETGGFSQRLDNFTAKLAQRRNVMESRTMDYALGRPPGSRAARMLFVFKSAEMLASALATLPDPAARAWRAVFFRTLPDVEEDFGGEWLQAGGERRFPFQPVQR